MRWRTWFSVVMMLLPRVAAAQGWTSTDVGAVGLAGSATESSGTWTVQGSGADIWGTADAFQFLHHASAASGSLFVRVDDVQAANAFAKAGLMVRDGVAANAAMAILDVKPNGGIEFMTRASTGAPVDFVAGYSSGSFPLWLRLDWATNGTLSAWTSADGFHWNFLANGGAALSSAPEAGIVVTSHDTSGLATAHFEQLSPNADVNDWTSVAVGDVGQSGSGIQNKGVWTLAGAGSDIWGPADSFQFLYRTTSVLNNNVMHVSARIDDLQDTGAFAKAGLMLRATPDADSPTVIFDVKPGGGLELMARGNPGDEMQYLGGVASVPFPVWLKLDWFQTGNDSTFQAVPAYSSDGITWEGLRSVTLANTAQYDVGVAVTSHDPSRTATVHVEHLSLLPDLWQSNDIGAAGLPGYASTFPSGGNTGFAVTGSGGDIWGTADSFQFTHAAPDAYSSLSYRIVSLDNTNPFAKGGLMYRDTLDPGAASVILDAKPDGGVEFMARLCGGCATTFIAGTTMTFPFYLTLQKSGATFTATVMSGTGSTSTSLGQVTIPMNAAYAGFAVTSHDPGRLTTAVFDDPAR